MIEKVSVILAGIEDTSTIDWYGKSSTILFFSGCNLRCGFCYNHKMMDKSYGRKYTFDELRDILNSNLPYIDAVVITGGEPTLQALELIHLCRFIKEEFNLPIMLDTNGTKPHIVKQMLQEKIIDRVALDIKSAFFEEDYEAVSGVSRNAVPVLVRETMMVTKQYDTELEVRTTIIPKINDSEYTISSITKSIKSLADVWYLQQFQPNDAYDEEFRKINRPSRNDMLMYAAYVRLGLFDRPLYIKSIENGLEEMPMTVRQINDLLPSNQ